MTWLLKPTVPAIELVPAPKLRIDGIHGIQWTGPNQICVICYSLEHLIEQPDLPAQRHIAARLDGSLTSVPTVIGQLATILIGKTPAEENVRGPRLVG